ncbi:MAG TPA: DUF1697 domain-containing protein [Gaiellaceae bacterium]
MQTFAALLRGVNVGGKVKMPMADLRATLSALGLEDVVTYIQSGNAVFRAPTSDERVVATDVERAIRKDFGHEVAVILRTHDELERVERDTPYPVHDAAPTRVHVVFLDEAPANTRASGLDPNRSPGDEFAVRGREIYLSFPHGLGRTKLTIDWFERGLGVRATARNWNTLRKLIELTGP